MSGEQRATGMQDMEAKVEAFRARCHEAGLKVTPQRTTVYRTLLASTEHPSAEVVFREVRGIFPSISLDTVNRTLLTLNRIGAAFIVEGSGEAKRFDANLQTHQHFKCVKCRRIIDFRHEPFDQIDVPKDLRDRFTVLRKTVYLEGLCDRCQKRAN